MADQLRHRAPDLVIYAYGTNEAGDATPAAIFERKLVDVLGRTSRAVPSASCLLLGPADRAMNVEKGWTTMPKLLEVIASERKVAEAAGCAFYDQLQSMGGPGTMAAWAEEARPRGRRDRVHFTRDGYAELGALFSNDLLRAYASWRAETGRPPSRHPPPSPPAAPPPGAAPSPLVAAFPR